ncbi:MAG: hypothetical protein OXM87_05450 [Truepera sp.]|nr:hypothetical protein [Truepera sp.]
MRSERFSDVGHFEAQVQSLPLEREIVHKLMLGILPAQRNGQGPPHGDRRTQGGDSVRRALHPTHSSSTHN